MKSFLKHLLAASLVTTVLMLTSCSSVKTKVDTGPVKASTFSFITPQRAPTDNTAAVHAIIQKAITQTLARKGLNNVPTGGDVTVGYLVIVGNTGETTAFDDYFGSGSDATDLMTKVHDAEAVGGDRQGYFAAGTLFIDIINPNTGKLLWRSSKQRDILQNPTPEMRTERIQEIVDAALQNLRVSS
jgi:PBP1b-binding outer membrane lipoprotein LpoB